jgi:hypothetical protein
MAENKPSWWSSAHELSWSKARAAAVEQWQKVTEGTNKLEKGVAERAIALGHGARDVYAKTGPWTSDVEAKLKADWERTQKDATNTWEKVRDAVKHGFDKSGS